MGCRFQHHIIIQTYYREDFTKHSKKSPTGPSEWTPKHEYLIALEPYRIPRGPLVRSYLIFDGNMSHLQLAAWPHRDAVLFASPVSLEAWTAQQKDAHHPSKQCSCYGYLEGVDEDVWNKQICYLGKPTNTHQIHGTDYIYLHLVDLYGKCGSHGIGNCYFPCLSESIISLLKTDSPGPFGHRLILGWHILKVMAQPHATTSNIRGKCSSPAMKGDELLGLYWCFYIYIYRYKYIYIPTYVYPPRT